jgi:ubiquinone/menaquinone biosynthesis C-methylase UbiE
MKPSKKFSDCGILARARGRAREDALCVNCGSLERHRLTWLYFDRMTDLFDGRTKRMLHIAPEQSFEGRLKKQLGLGYITADICPGRATVQMDIIDIQFPNEIFDVIYCSHVLEHVSDDKRAICELYRVLKSSGWAILAVPILLDKTFENPMITSPEERQKLFGQYDHVRIYGLDFLERLKEAGFNVKVTEATDFLKKEEIIRMGITQAAGSIYYCTKK